MRPTVAFGLAVALVAALVERRVVAAPPRAVSAADAGSLRATLWSQSSGEWRASALQAYALAERLLEQGVADPCWTADVEQQRSGGYARLPPCVVLDVDETVLDNSPAQARWLRRALLEPGTTDAFVEADWNAWIEEARATAIPGARRFLDHATRLGVAAFFVTNREDSQRAATVRNLRGLGIGASATNVLTRNAAEGRPSDKTSRRRSIARSHRIVLLVGDDLNDFVAGTRRTTAAERNRVLERHAAYLGTRWVILPNPVYGGWWEAVEADPLEALRVR